MSQRLIINADDYGRTPDISRGIRHAHLQGLVTSTTCMMNMPSAVRDIQTALQETPLLGLGVHLVLTSGRPVLSPADVHSLTGHSGEFYRLSDFIQNCQDIDPAELKAEWRAQVEAFIAAAGEMPTHLDSHHHSSFYTPALLETMLELAAEYKVGVRLPLEHRKNITLAELPEDMAEVMLDYAPRILDRMQPKSPDVFYGSFYDQGATRGELISILDDILPNSTVEIMCHPGFVDEAFSRESTYSFQRHEEIEILTDPRMRKEVEKRGIQLIHFGMLE